MAELKGLRVVENFLDVPFTLSVWCQLVRSQVVSLLVEHVEVLCELEVGFFPLVVLLCLHILVEFLKDARIARINLDLEFY